MNNLMTRSFLNYVELKKQARIDSESGSVPAPDLESGPAFTHAEEENLSVFFAEVEPIQSEMESISGLLSDLTRLDSESKSTHTPKLLRGLHDRMDSDVTAILRKAHVVKARLAALDASNAASRTRFGEGTPVDRARASVTNGLRSKLRDTMSGLNSLRERILEEHEAGLKRRYFAATGKEAGDEEMEQDGAAATCYDGPGEGVEERERERAVSELKRSLTRLHQVFLDMAVVVEAQEEHLNDIEENVAKAKEFISGGTGRLAEAVALKRRRRNWTRNWLVLLVVAVTLVCLILGFSD